MKKRYRFTYRIKVLEDTGNVEVPALNLFAARKQAKAIVQHHYKTRGVPVSTDNIELTALTIPVEDEKR